MNNRWRTGGCALSLALLWQGSAPIARQQTATTNDPIAVRTAVVDGLKLHTSPPVTDQRLSCCTATPRPRACGDR